MYSLVRFWTFRTTTYDLVIFDQAVRRYSRFHAPTAIVKGVHNGFGPRLQRARRPLLADPGGARAAVLDPRRARRRSSSRRPCCSRSTIIPLWAFARRRLGAWQAYCVTGVYALAWPVAATVAFDFHEMAFAPVLSMRHARTPRRGPPVAVRRRGRRAPAGQGGHGPAGRRVRDLPADPASATGARARLFVAAGLVWTWLAARVLIPAFGGAADYYWAYDALGRDLPHAAVHALTHPWDAARLLVTPHVKVTTMLWLVAPLLILPLASPITLSVLPLLAERMLSSRFGHWWEPRFHYNVALIALLVAAGVDGAVRLRAAAPAFIGPASGRSPRWRSPWPSCRTSR